MKLRPVKIAEIMLDRQPAERAVRVDLVQAGHSQKYERRHHEAQQDDKMRTFGVKPRPGRERRDATAIDDISRSPRPTAPVAASSVIT